MSRLRWKNAYCTTGGLPDCRSANSPDLRVRRLQTTAGLFVPPFHRGRKPAFCPKTAAPFFLIRIPGLANQYARIKNISEGGVCFAQQYNAAPITDRLIKLDLYNCNEGSSLEQLPVEVVATSEQILDINGIKTTILNTRARFVDLNQAQKKVLFSCLTQQGLSA